MPWSKRFAGREQAALRQHHGKVDAIAKAPGISRKGLYLTRRRLGP
jgi:hypothetical protein